MFITDSKVFQDYFLFEMRVLEALEEFNRDNGNVCTLIRLPTSQDNFIPVVVISEETKHKFLYFFLCEFEDRSEKMRLEEEPFNGIRKYYVFNKKMFDTLSKGYFLKLLNEYFVFDLKIEKPCMEYKQLKLF